MIRTLASFTISTFLLTALPGRSADATPGSSAPFALISPQVAAALKNQGSTPEAKAIIAEADAGLSAQPHPLRYHIEGTLPHQGIWDQSLVAVKDFPLMQNFGLAYRLTGDHRYLDAEDRYLLAWLDVYAVSLNPIDENILDQFIYSYDLTSTDLPQTTQDKMHTFLSSMANGYLDAIDKAKAINKEDKSNWQSHRIKMITLSSFALGDPALIDRAHKAFLEQVSVNIDSTGMPMDFIRRDALHYVVYDLEPLTVASLAAKAHGQDWFHEQVSSGSSVALGFDWLTPFALGEKTHQEFVHSKIGFDAKRAKAGMKGYSGMWNPATSIGLYHMGSVLDPKYQDTLQQVEKTGGTSAGKRGWFDLMADAGLWGPAVASH